MRLRIYLIIVVLLLIILYVGGCRRAGSWLVKDDEPKHADAIMILMGSISDRVLQAVDLYEQKIASRVIFVEVSVKAYKDLESRGFHIRGTTEEVHDAVMTLGIPSDSIIILPGDATSTQMEAMIMRKHIINSPGIDTLIIVSSAPHTRRASIIFEAAFRKAEIPVTVLCSPSPFTNFNSERWWHTKDGIRLVLSEYIKLADFIFFEKRKLNER